MKNKNIITHITKAALATALILISLVAKAAVTTEPSGTCGDGLTYTFNSETGALVISKTGDGSCGIKGFAFDQHEDIKSVTIEEGVKKIGTCAFSDCTNLTSVTIPESVTTVGAYAFTRCIKLENVYIYFNPDKLDFWSVWGDDFITDPKGATKGHVFAKYLEGFEKFKERTGINLTFVDDVTQLTADDITTSQISDVTYSGTSLTPEIEVKYGDETLEAGTDYTITYSNNTNAGTAKATITGIKLYFFTKEVEFTINPVPVTVTAENKNKTFGESDPEFTAKVTGLVNDESPDLIKYTFSRTEGENVGEYTITAKGDEKQGNYVVTFVDGKLTINAESENIETATEDIVINSDIKIWSFEKTIFVENATKEIVVVDVVGRVVKIVKPMSDRTEIQFNKGGVYIVKSGIKTQKLIIQ